LQIEFLQYQALLEQEQQSTKDNQDTLSLASFFISCFLVKKKHFESASFFLHLHNKAPKNKVEM